MRILLAEDERALGEWLTKALEQAGFKIDWADDGRIAQQMVVESDYDALVLDLGLPGRGGHEVLKKLRALDLRLPVIILTARDSLPERISCLNEGADDFLAKPFAVAELEARLTALVRRSRGMDHPRFACGPLSYDSVSRQFLVHREPLVLPPREYRLLKVLIQHGGSPISKQEILDRVFEDGDDVLPTAIEVLVHRLRKKLENSGVSVRTYRGLGYVLEAETKP